MTGRYNSSVRDNNLGNTSSGACPTSTAAAASQSGNGCGNRYFIATEINIYLTKCVISVYYDENRFLFCS